MNALTYILAEISPMTFYLNTQKKKRFGGLYQAKKSSKS